MYWLYYYYYFGNTRNHVLKNYEKPFFQTRYKFKKLKPSFFNFLDGEILCVCILNRHLANFLLSINYI